jgi:gas vesicle protein GvpL/GvpF
LVSALPSDRIPGRRDELETHRRVLALASERGTTIPMRFGVVIDSEQLVREELLIRHAGSWNHDPRGDGTCCASSASR